MLVLSRRNQQSIIIGDDVIVTLLEARGGHARLGITAPDNIEVDRLEVRAAKDRERGKGEQET